MPFQGFDRLVAADAHCCLHLLKKSHSTNEETVFDFGGGLSGDVGRTLTGVEFCGGRGEDSYRYVATVSGALPWTCPIII